MALRPFRSDASQMAVEGERVQPSPAEFVDRKRPGDGDPTTLVGHSPQHLCTPEGGDANESVVRLDLGVSIEAGNGFSAPISILRVKRRHPRRSCGRSAESFGENGTRRCQ